MKNVKAIIVPGNGDDNPEDKWFPYIKRELEKLGIKVINQKYPDPILARKEYWLPFIKERGADQNTILIGHSSGSVAAMRFAEENKILGSVLVGAYVSDLGSEDEKKSGYFNTPWNWTAIKQNQHWIIQFASTDDPFIPISEAREINNKLNTKYYEYTDQGHFGSRENKVEFPEMIAAIEERLRFRKRD